MKSLVQDFKTGNATRRIGIAADIASLLGLSIVAIATGLFSLSGRLDISNTVFATAQSLLFIGGLAVLAAVYWIVSLKVGATFQSSRFVSVMLQVAVTMIFLSVVIVGGLLFYGYLSSFRYVLGGA